MPSSRAHRPRSNLDQHGVERKDYNFFSGSRRGNHEVTIRGTFAKSGRRTNWSCDDVVGGDTRYFNEG